MSEDQVLSIEDGSETEIVVQGSRFLGQAFGCDSPEAAAERVSAVRRRYHNATHHCWAWRIGLDGPMERWDDDSEPSGTAGPPILKPLQHEHLTQAMIVVTRYFGGVKLGTGGLARAYGEAARTALAAAARRVIWLTRTLSLRCDYADLGVVENCLHRTAGDLRDIRREFETGPCFVVEVVRSRAERFRADLIERTAGRIRIDG